MLNQLLESEAATHASSLRASKRALPRVHENLENLPPHRRTASTFALGKQVRDPGSGPEANSLLRGRSQFS